MAITVKQDAVASFGSVEPGKDFFLDDVFESDDKEKPISSGIFIYNKSEKDFECAQSLLLPFVVSRADSVIGRRYVQVSVRKLARK